MGMGLVSRLGNETHPHLNPPLEGEERLGIKVSVTTTPPKSGVVFLFPPNPNCFIIAD